MVARPLERSIDPAEHAGTLVLDERELAMNRHRSAYHLAAENLSDRLVAETHAEDRNGRGRFGDELEADAGVVRRTGAGRKHDGIGIGRDHLIGRDLIVTMDNDLRAQPTEIVEQVESEA